MLQSAMQQSLQSERWRDEYEYGASSSSNNGGIAFDVSEEGNGGGEGGSEDAYYRTMRAAEAEYDAALGGDYYEYSGGGENNGGESAADRSILYGHAEVDEYDDNNNHAQLEESILHSSAQEQGMGAFEGLSEDEMTKPASRTILSASSIGR